MLKMSQLAQQTEHPNGKQLSIKNRSWILKPNNSKADL